MQESQYFQLKEEVTPEVLQLLTKTTLGTNGAMYQHLDIEHRIFEADNPLFLTLERNNKVLGNITFCRRNAFWYIRYFAFDTLYQASNKNGKKRTKKSVFKQELQLFFEAALSGNSDEKIENFYAYIDPRNTRSRWMSEQFGFQKIAQLKTQSFSRLYPKNQRVDVVNDWNKVKDLIHKNYKEHLFYFEAHTTKPPYYVIYDNHSELIAVAKATIVNWKITKLPGKFGGTLTKLIPYIPFIKRLIKPEKHTFLVPEMVCSKNNDPQLVEELFEGILALHKLNVMLWWMDEKDPLYTALSQNVKWGLLDKIVGSPEVDVVVRSGSNKHKPIQQPVFVAAFDMV